MAQAKLAIGPPDTKIDLPPMHKARRNTQGPSTIMFENQKLPKVSSRSADYVYVNTAYAGSVQCVNENRRVNSEPVTSVVREQYWACSRWPFAQRILAIAVGVLMGAVIGLAVTMAITGKDSSEVIGGIFRSPVPD